jgi:hypothetical protein
VNILLNRRKLRNNGNNITTAIQGLIDNMCLPMANRVIAINFVFLLPPGIEIANFLKLNTLGNGFRM